MWRVGIRSYGVTPRCRLVFTVSGRVPRIAYYVLRILRIAYVHRDYRLQPDFRFRFDRFDTLSYGKSSILSSR